MNHWEKCCFYANEKIQSKFSLGERGRGFLFQKKAPPAVLSLYPHGFSTAG